MDYKTQLQDAARNVLDAARYCNLTGAGMFALANAIDQLADELVEPTPTCRRKPSRLAIAMEMERGVRQLSERVEITTDNDDELPF